jgi:hypothetical protein
VPQRIFPIVPSVEQRLAHAKKGQLFMTPGSYERINQTAIQRLSQPDFIGPDEAARKLSTSVDAFMMLVEKGEVLLIEMDGVQAVPLWQFNGEGQISALVLDIAKEFVRAEQHVFSFMPFIHFMAEHTVDISSALPKEKLTAAFQAAGVSQFSCGLSVQATVNQLVGMADRAEMRSILCKELARTVNKAFFGERPDELSEYFREKYVKPSAANAVWTDPTTPTLD